MRRSLIHFWRQHLAVALGCAVATAVLTGALAVGDSVRGSLLAMTLERLGDTEQAILSSGFFRQELAAQVAEGAKGKQGAEGKPGESRAAAGILLPGAVRGVDGGRRASGVSILGVDGAFLSLYPEELRPQGWTFGAAGDSEGSADAKDPGGALPPVILNQSLADELGVTAGDAVVLSVPQAVDVPRASLLGRKDSGSQLRTLRCQVSAVVEDQGAAVFALSSHQGLPWNAFLPLARLQRAVGRPGQANLLLAGGGERSPETWDEELRSRLTLEDLGLKLRPVAGGVALESRQLVLQDETVTSATALGESLGARAWPVLTYLANDIRIGDRTLPYAAVGALPAAAFRGLVSPQGEAVAAPGAGEMLINAWAAEDLRPVLGEEAELDYFTVGDREQLVTATARLRVTGIVGLEGIGADPSLTPEVPGIYDAADMAAWDPPFPVDLARIGPRDEAYWDLYRGAPKALVGLEEGQRLWRSRWGAVTSLRFVGYEDGAAFTAALARDLPGQLPLATFSMAFRPIRQEGVAAAQGATDFAGLFLAFSWFLIAAAVLLTSLLFSLGVEQRSREVGLLRAVGFPERAVRRRFLAEAWIVALAGAALGLLGARVYGWLMILGLRTWWSGAVGSERLALHLTPSSLALGFGAALAVSMLAIFLSLRRLRTLSLPVLLAGGSLEGGGRAPSPARPRWLLRAMVALAVSLTVLAWLVPKAAAAAAFGAGAAMLIAGLAYFTWRCRRPLGEARWASAAGSGTAGAPSLLSLAARNSLRNPRRSLLSLSLVASATFVLVLTALNRRPLEVDATDRGSGTGGFTLLATSEVPLLQDLGTADGRFELGLGPAAEAGLAGAEVFPLRVLAGDDASCLNLYQVERPRVLGLPAALIERGGFHFQEQAEARANPWTLLQEPLARNPQTGAWVVPAVADFETARWILKRSLGDSLSYQSERGEAVELKLVGLLHASIFQSELLVSEAHLLHLFPSLEGYGSFLVAADPAASSTLATALEEDLRDFGFDVTTTGAKLASFKAVQNTYLSTFQTLGGLGLLLGTLGLAVVLLRNVLERRGEMAVLEAFGFRLRRLRRWVLVENLLLMVEGVALGTVAALVAAGPYLLESLHQLPWGSIAGTLALVLASGTLACAVATRRAVRGDLVGSLRSL